MRLQVNMKPFPWRNTPPYCSHMGSIMEETVNLLSRRVTSNSVSMQLSSLDTNPTPAPPC
jgi:hypothetical protein